jgi:hypothetical protein
MRPTSRTWSAMSNPSRILPCPGTFRGDQWSGANADGDRERNARVQLGAEQPVSPHFRCVPAAEDVATAHERWRRHIREYQADPSAWDRNYYQHMIIDFAKDYGPERAREFGGKLVASGELRDADVAAALAQDPGVE